MKHERKPKSIKEQFIETFANNNYYTSNQDEQNDYLSYNVNNGYILDDAGNVLDDAGNLVYDATNLVDRIINENVYEFYHDKRIIIPGVIHLICVIIAIYMAVQYNPTTDFSAILLALLFPELYIIYKYGQLQYSPSTNDYTKVDVNMYKHSYQPMQPVQYTQPMQYMQPMKPVLPMQTQFTQPTQYMQSMKPVLPMRTQFTQPIVLTNMNAPRMNTFQNIPVPGTARLI